jgi:hypothetical protein
MGKRVLEEYWPGIVRWMKEIQPAPDEAAGQSRI